MSRGEHTPTPSAPPPRYRQSVVLAALSAANIGGGFLMHWYLLAHLGAGVETDALFATLALPQTLLAIVASAVINVLVPLLIGETEREFSRRAWTFVALTTGVFVALAAILGLTPAWWVPLLAPGLPADVLGLAVSLARIQLLGMVCTALAGVLTPVNRARRRFYLVEIAPVVSTIVAGYALVVWLPLYGVTGAAWAWVVRIAVNAGMLAPGMGRFRGLITDRRVLGDVWQRLRPLILGTVYLRTEPVFDRAVVSLAPAGDLSLFYLCQQVCYAGIQLANNALIAPMTPTLALQARQHQWQTFSLARRRLAVTVGALSLAAFVVLIAGGLAWRSGWIAGVTPPAASGRAVLLFGILGGMFVAGPVFECLRSAYYATGNTAASVRLEVVVYTCGLLMKVAGFAAFGVFGLAAAISLQGALGIVGLGGLLSRFEAERRALHGAG